MCRSIVEAEPERKVRQPRVKTHKTVRITDKLLKKLDACDRARERLKQFLPAVISTDPNKNHAIAEALFEEHEKSRHVYLDPMWTAWWLIANTPGAGNEDYPNIEDYPNDYYVDQEAGSTAATDIAAQWLAIAADRLLTAKGR